MNPLDHAAHIFSQAIGQLTDGKNIQPFDFKVDYAEAQFGDFTTNAAFGLAAQLKQSPGEVAEALVKLVKHEGVGRVESAAGYVNLTMAPEFWLKRLEEIDTGYGSNKLGEGQKVQVEFISANPTGPLTLGNARGGFVGDVIARVLEHSGYDVTREYYFNDAGTQIGKLVQSVKAAGAAKADDDVEYRGQYIDQLAKQFADELTHKSDAELGKQLTQKIFKTYIQPAVEKMGIEIDVWFNESDLIGKPFDDALKRLKDAGLFAEKEGAQWALTSKLGDERDRVLRKSNGDVTYLGSDIPYHLNIFEERGFDRAIKEWGADHAGQVPSLRLLMQKLCPDKRLDFVIHQFVRLVRDGQEVKMSKRAGTYVTTDELIEEVGNPDIARFFFLMRSADSHMDFDLGLAKEQGQKNPFWYVMYAYVRACSILREADAKGLQPGPWLNAATPAELALISHMTRLPALVRQMASDYSVHRLTFYGIELGKLFHDYYEAERIIGLSPEQAAGKLYLIRQFTIFMKVYFELLGLNPVEKM